MTTISQVSGYHADSRKVKAEESIHMFVPTYSKRMVEEPVDTSKYLSSSGGGIRENNGSFESKSLSHSQSFFDWETAPEKCERKRETERFADVVITVCSTDEPVDVEEEEAADSEEEESDEEVLEYPPNQDDNTKAIIIEELSTESSGDELSSWQSTSSLKKEGDLPNEKERNFSKEGVCAGVESRTTLVEVEAASSTPASFCGIGDLMCGVPLLQLFGWYKNDNQINELNVENKNSSCDDTAAESCVESSDEESTDIDSTDAESIPSDEGPRRRQKAEQESVGISPSDNNSRKQNDNSHPSSCSALATSSSTLSHTNIHKACDRASVDEDESKQDQSTTLRPRDSFDEELFGDETNSFSADEQEPILKQKSISFELPQNESADSERHCYGVIRYLQDRSKVNTQLKDEGDCSNSVSESSSAFSLAAGSFEISSTSGSESSGLPSSLLSSESSSGYSMASSSLLGPRLV